MTLMSKLISTDKKIQNFFKIDYILIYIYLIFFIYILTSNTEFSKIIDNVFVNNVIYIILPIVFIYNKPIAFILFVYLLKNVQININRINKENEQYISIVDNNTINNNDNNDNNDENIQDDNEENSNNYFFRN